MQLLYGVANPSPHVKDAFHEAVVRGNAAGVNPSAWERRPRRITGSLGRPARNRVRFGCDLQRTKKPGDSCFRRFRSASPAQRREEADEFYGALAPSCLSSEHCAIQRQALAGMLWTKQFYYYVVEQWLDGDPAQPPPPAERKHRPQRRLA